MLPRRDRCAPAAPVRSMKTSIHTKRPGRRSFGQDRFISLAMRAIARIQMRNRRQQPLHCQSPKTLPRNTLQQTLQSPPSGPLRKIRDLIIFRKNQAQMRKGIDDLVPGRELATASLCFAAA